MGPVLVLALTVLQQPQRSEETMPGPLTVAVDVQRETVTLTAQPPEGRTVRWVILDLPDSRSWAKPTTSEGLAKQGVRATFRHPHAPYAFEVRLDDDTQYRVTVLRSGRLDVRAVPGPPRRTTAPF